MLSRKIAHHLDTLLFFPIINIPSQWEEEIGNGKGMKKLLFNKSRIILFGTSLLHSWSPDFPGGSDSKVSAYNVGDLSWIHGSGRSLGEGHDSSIIAWKIPWTEEPGRLQSLGSQRVRHNWATSLLITYFSQRKGIGIGDGHLINLLGTVVWTLVSFRNFELLGKA